MPKAKIAKEEFASIPKEWQSEYLPQDDGSYLLKVEPVDGLSLGPVAGKQAALDRERALREKHERTIADFADDDGNAIDIGKAKAAIKKVAEYGNLSKDDKVREQIAAAVAAAKEELGKEIKRLSDENGSLNGQLDVSVVDADLNAAIAKTGVDGMIRDSIRKYLKREVDPATKKPVTRVYGEDGALRYNKDVSKPLDVVGLLEDLSGKPEYKLFYPGTGTSGTGGTSPGRPGSPLGRVTITESEARDHGKWTARTAEAAKVGQKFPDVVPG